MQTQQYTLKPGDNLNLTNNTVNDVNYKITTVGGSVIEGTVHINQTFSVRAGGDIAEFEINIDAGQYGLDAVKISEEPL